VQRQWTGAIVLVLASLLAIVVVSSVPSVSHSLTPQTIGQQSYDRYGIGQKLRDGDFRLYDNGQGRLRWVYNRTTVIQDKHGNQYELVVEDDRLVYVFDNHGNFLNKIEAWRDIGEFTLIEVTRQQAESMAAVFSQEDVTGSSLVLMHPETYRYNYQLDSPAANPCWVVYTSSFRTNGSVVIDAVTSDIIGRGLIMP
jgi:hypothetical protein